MILPNTLLLPNVSANLRGSTTNPVPNFDRMLLYYRIKVKPLIHYLSPQRYTQFGGYFTFIIMRIGKSSKSTYKIQPFRSTTILAPNYLSQYHCKFSI